MARKRKSKEIDFIEFLLLAPPFLVFYLVFQLSKDFSTALTLAIITFLLMFAILIYRKLAWVEKLKRSGISDIDKMSGREFENYLGVLLKGLGYSVNVTKESGDYGADLVISKDGKKIVVQAKRYSKNVSLKAVQEAVAAKAHYGAVEAWVVTNSGFTEAALKLARSNNVKMYDRDELINLILKMKSVSAASQKAEREVAAGTEKHVCDKCGSPMVVRKGPSMTLLACKKFPKCKGVKALL